MLRAVVLQSSRQPAALRSVVVGCQWQRAPATAIHLRRSFANGNKPDPTHSAGIPGVPGTSPAKPSSTTPIPPEKVTPPPPPQKVQTAPPTSIPSSAGSTSSASPPPPPPPPPKPRKKGRIRRFFYISIFTLGLAYAGGVYYALVSDGFHDFFVDNIPWGEDVVLFFEERAFKRRFPNGVASGSTLYPQVSGENKVTISGKSGASARVSDKKDTQSNTDGKHNSAIDAESQKKPGSTGQSGQKQEPATSAASQDSSKQSSAAAKKTDEGSKSSTTKTTSTSKTQEKKPAAEKKADEKKPTSASKPATPAKKETKDAAASATPSTTTSSTGSSSESASASAATGTGAGAGTAAVIPIALFGSDNVENASDAVVQRVSKMLNDIITVINADDSSRKFSPAMAKAKDDLKGLAAELATYRASEAKAAEEKIKQTEAEFDKGAKELLERIQQEQKEQELKWREEYEAERERLSDGYQNKLKAELEAAQKVADQKRHNELLQQDIKLQEAFAQSVRDRVENERDARLSKLDELSSAVSELENLTGQWNEVVDSNLQTQRLVVAVDAVRAAFEDADRPRPFLQELAALKEVAGGDGVIDAAIASIEPTAYQRGVPTSGQLVDRFRRVASEVRKAALLPEDAGIASHAASLFLSKLLFKKEGMAAGEDVESILTRTETLLEEGELDEAAREMNGLTGWAKVLSQDWLKDCRRVLEVRQAIEVIAAEARLQSLLLE